MTSRIALAVQKWRKDTKARMVEAFGGKCGICSYNKCNDALEFHHLDPSVKEETIGALRADMSAWNKMVIELRKCVMLCVNCHREVHYNNLEIPENIIRFNEEYADYKARNKKIKENAKQKDNCPVCGKIKNIDSSTCSRQCGYDIIKKIQISEKEMYELLKTHNYSALGRILGVSDNAIRKRVKRYSQDNNLPNPR